MGNQANYIPVPPKRRVNLTTERVKRGMSAAEAVAELKGRVCAGLETIQICRMFENSYHVRLPIMTALCDLSEGKIDVHTCLNNMLSGIICCRLRCING